MSRPTRLGPSAGLVVLGVFVVAGLALVLAVSGRLSALNEAVSARLVSEQPKSSGSGANEAMGGVAEAGPAEQLAREATREGSSGKLTRPRPDEVACNAEVVGEENGRVVAVYRVDRGRLGELCYGSDNRVVLDAWSALNEFADPMHLEPIRLFAGVESDALAAFAGPLSDPPYQDFLIAVDVYSAAGDAEELRLTMAHELSHVFTQLPGQYYDKLVAVGCDTYYNGFFCFEDGSYIADWVEAFWDEEVLASLPRSGVVDAEGGDTRCLLNPAFLGTYAASHPEEDFAESFSAFVFSVEVAPEVQAKLEFFRDYPELVAYRDRAENSGWTQLRNGFDRCG